MNRMRGLLNADGTNNHSGGAATLGGVENAVESLALSEAAQPPSPLVKVV